MGRPSQCDGPPLRRHGGGLGARDGAILCRGQAARRLARPPQPRGGSRRRVCTSGGRWSSCRIAVQIPKCTTGMEPIMPSSNKADPIPRVPKDIFRRILPCDNPFVTDADSMIGQMNALSAKLPRRYGWRFRTAEGMAAEMAELSATAADAVPLNALYWRDQLGNWEAYSLMNTLRVIDLARSCVWALARGDAVCASLLARSVLETAAAFVDAARTVSATISGSTEERKPSAILDPHVDLRTTIVNNEELEKYSLKTIFASRLPESETIYIPINIFTIITRISKIQNQEFVLGTYGILCEAAHPNLPGRTLYLQGVEPGRWVGNELRTIGPGNGPTWHSLARHIVAALSWACATQVSAFNLMAETIGTTINRLKTVEQVRAG